MATIQIIDNIRLEMEKMILICYYPLEKGLQWEMHLKK